MLGTLVGYNLKNDFPWWKILGASLAVTIILSLIFSGGCAKTKVITMPFIVNNGGVIDTIFKDVTVTPYGLINGDKKVERVEYKLSVGNLIWSFLLVKTIGIPIWLIGWELFEPVGLKQELTIIYPSKKEVETIPYIITLPPKE